MRTAPAAAAETLLQPLARPAPLAPPPAPVAPSSGPAFPIFNGDSPSFWISRAEQYFWLHHTPDADRIDLSLGAMMDSALPWLQWLLHRSPNITWHRLTYELLRYFGEDTMAKMMDSALPWLQWLLHRSPNLTWHRLTYELLRYFGEDTMANPFEVFVSTRQTDSVTNYIKTFIMRVSHIPGLDESYTLGVFLNGLRDDIRVCIRSSLAVDLPAAMHMAREIERELKGTWPPPTALDHAFRQPPGGNSGSSNTSVVPASSTASKTPNFKRVSPAEYTELRSKGLCFRCREPYSPDHVCQQKSLRVMLMTEQDQDPSLPLELQGMELFNSRSEMLELQEPPPQPCGQGCFYPGGN